VGDSDNIPRIGDLDEIAHDLAERALAPDGSAEDAAALRAFAQQGAAHARAMADAVELHGRLQAACGALRTEPAIAATMAWAKGWREPPPQAVFGRRAFVTGAVAASAAGVATLYPPFGLWPTLDEMRADYRTGTGERRTVTIAQGLQVELNTRTAVARGSDDRAYRLRLISGEVAVDARRLARPAVIETRHGQASATDGQFSARLRDDGFCVTCSEGAIDVRAPDRPAIRLVRGQQVTVGGNDAPAVVPVDPAIADAWRRGALIFNGQPLTEVVGELNRYRAGRIVLTNGALGTRKVNGIFQLDRLGNAPVQIGNLTQAKVTNLPGGIALLS